jgi:hypothetical protein
MNRIGVSFVLALSLAASGCWFGRKKPQAASTPPPPAPLSTPTPKTKPIEPPPETLPAKPVQSLPEMPQVQPANTPAETPPPKPVAKRVVRKPAPKAPSATAAATVPPPPASPQPAAAAVTPPVPQLGVLLTPEQRNQYEAEYSRDMASAMDGLIHVLESSLSPSQKESMTRIRSFMRQAEEAHGRDLATAAQLARRAAVLAQDLVQSQR